MKAQPTPPRPESDPTVAAALMAITMALESIHAAGKRPAALSPPGDAVAAVKSRLRDAVDEAAPSVRAFQKRFQPLLAFLDKVLALESRAWPMRDSVQSRLRQAVKLATELRASIGTDLIGQILDDIRALDIAKLAGGWESHLQHRIAGLAGLEKDIEGKLDELLFALQELARTTATLGATRVIPRPTPERVEPQAFVVTE